MKDQELKKQRPEKSVRLNIDEFDDLLDEEYFEMMELMEKARNKEITPEELEKLKYIQKTRENLYGGDA